MPYNDSGAYQISNRKTSYDGSNHTVNIRGRSYQLPVITGGAQWDSDSRIQILYDDSIPLSHDVTTVTIKVEPNNGNGAQLLQHMGDIQWNGYLLIDYGPFEVNSGTTTTVTVTLPFNDSGAYQIKAINPAANYFGDFHTVDVNSSNEIVPELGPTYRIELLNGQFEKNTIYSLQNETKTKIINFAIDNIILKANATLPHVPETHEMFDILEIKRDNEGSLNKDTRDISKLEKKQNTLQL